jgi:hypothetical protein
MFGSETTFGILVGNFESSLIVFEDRGLEILDNDVRQVNMAWQGWMQVILYYVLLGANWKRFHPL